MTRNIANPVDAGGAEGSVGVEATGDYARNLTLFQFINKLNLTVNLCNRCINLSTLFIQPCRYRLLLSKRGIDTPKFLKSVISIAGKVVVL